MELEQILHVVASGPCGWAYAPARVGTWVEGSVFVPFADGPFAAPPRDVTLVPPPPAGVHIDAVLPYGFVIGWENVPTWQGTYAAWA